MIAKLSKNKRGFTLVEIMIVVAIIGLLAAIAVPSFVRARLRAQATTILNECRMVDAAKDQYAVENNKSGTSTVNWADLTPYLKAGSRLASTATGLDSLGNQITGVNGSTVGTRVQVNGTTRIALETATGGAGVLSDPFWGPYS